ncbi:MAG: tetratricopeptide repeat protein [Synechococcales cyanobacterium RM1_1_8]|nr:tetratricopeptide repeat protein [Synechococcales cyanobacterium RM1_1_8]
MTYLLPALESLAEVGAQQELRDLTSQFEGFLGSLRLGKTPAMAAALDRLAGLYFDQGRYSEAEPMYLKALEIRKAEPGDPSELGGANRHSSTASSLNNLAQLYQSQGRYGEAEPLLVEALEIRKSELGERHPDTAKSLNNLAGLYYETERYSQALTAIEQALQIYIPALGVDHPTTQTANGWLQAIQQKLQG